MALVDFIIGGAAKSGTTSLYEYFDRHPGVCMSFRKEPNYFSKHYERGESWYDEFFDHCGGGLLRGEASVSYLVFARRSARRLYDDVPSARLLFILRNPVERAYSDYWFAVRQGRLQHRKGLFGDLIRGNESIPSYWRPQHDVGDLLIRRGKYYDSLSTYYDHFDREQTKVLVTGDLSTSGFEDASEFLGVDPLPDKTPHANAGSYPTSEFLYAVYKVGRRVASLFPKPLHEKPDGWKRRVKTRFFQGEAPPPMSAEDRRYLEETYEASVKDLEDLIDRDLSHWI
jgi:hypothetical protein